MEILDLRLVGNTEVGFSANGLSTSREDLCSLPQPVSVDVLLGVLKRIQKALIVEFRSAYPVSRFNSEDLDADRGRHFPEQRILSLAGLYHLRTVLK